MKLELVPSPDIRRRNMKLIQHIKYMCLRSFFLCSRQHLTAHNMCVIKLTFLIKRKQSLKVKEIIHRI